MKMVREGEGKTSWRRFRKARPHLTPLCHCQTGAVLGGEYPKGKERSLLSWEEQRNTSDTVGRYEYDWLNLLNNLGRVVVVPGRWSRRPAHRLPVRPTVHPSTIHHSPFTIHTLYLYVLYLSTYVGNFSYIHIHITERDASRTIHTYEFND